MLSYIIAIDPIMDLDRVATYEISESLPAQPLKVINCDFGCDI